MATVDADPVITADEDFNDGDSSLGGDTATSTESLRSSILGYRHENGRTYHRYRDGKYNLPNDSEEKERLDLQHHLCLLTFDNKLGFCPPNLPGSNAINFGDEHPEAEVVGVDLSPSQPNMVPPNVQFIIDDIDEDWTYSKPFDYIHSRMMNFSVQNWPVYLQKIYDNLTPGGWVELQEVDVIMGCDDGTLSEDDTLAKWCKLLEEAATKLGRNFEKTSSFKGYLTDAGFTDIIETRFKWPTNRWPKDPKYKELGA
ncbi:hypothetical protein N0V84_000528 [Fusarium piperis]|uniref:Methyltransferase n=1 Tax=Fusarium piperis TaxID=1435070 RepID=A0A9W9BUN3_9HYPO|nr:hypothetical protein N0V84_000528 [Fusarium piperis]